MSEDESTDPSAEEQTTVRDRTIDRVSPGFFHKIVGEYVDDDRLTGGEARLEIDGERTRRVVVGESVADLDETAYVRAELAELIDVLEAGDRLLEQPLELEVPVEDRERVVEEVTEEGTVTVLFNPEGVQSLLQEMAAWLAEDDERES